MVLVGGMWQDFLDSTFYVQVHFNAFTGGFTHFLIDGGLHHPIEGEPFRRKLYETGVVCRAVGEIKPFHAAVSGTGPRRGILLQQRYRHSPKIISWVYSLISSALCPARG